MRFVAVLTLAALGLSACSAGEDSLQDEPEAAEVESEAAEVEPDPDPDSDVDGEERRPSAEERREATLERQRQERQEQQEREAQQECDEVGRDAEEFDVLTVEATTSDLSNFGASGDKLTLTFSSCVSPGSLPIVRFGTITPIKCTDPWVECVIDGTAVTVTWSDASSSRRDLTNASVIDVLDTTDVYGDPVQVTAPVPVTGPRPSSLPELSQEIAQQQLADVAQQIAAAWLDGESDFTELDQALMSEAQRLVDEHAPLEADDSTDARGDWQRSVIVLSEGGISELGGEWSPYITFTEFTAIGIPGVPATIFGGVHEVGDTWEPEVAVPGTYVTHDVEGCYWERLDDAGNIIDNNFINAAPRVEVTITASDFAFNSEGCGRWAQTDY